MGGSNLPDISNNKSVIEVKTKLKDVSDTVAKEKDKAAKDKAAYTEELKNIKSKLDQLASGIGNGNIGGIDSGQLNIINTKIEELSTSLLGQSKSIISIADKEINDIEIIQQSLTDLCDKENMDIINIQKTITTLSDKEIDDINSLNLKIDNIKNIVGNVDDDYRANLVMNADFQVWQRGETFNITTSAATITADRWYVSSASNIPYIVSKDINGLKLSSTSSNVTRNIFQRIERSGGYNGFILNTKIAYSVSIDGRLYTGSFDLSGSVNIPIATGIQLTIIAEASVLYSQIQISFTDSLAHTIQYIKLEANDIATQFVPKSYADEIRDCQRYYERGNSTFVDILNIATTYLSGAVFKVRKRTIPTVTIYSDSTFSTSGTNRISTYAGVLSAIVSEISADENCIKFLRTSTTLSTKTSYCFSYIADAEL